ncbi:MAG: hypothetical protein UZ12_BCD005000695 [Bacteroidetes bacterium OLB12]|nr:MAG: hypothetical protein UZ12_BCD005000695 [Bacteroidetes bacterium OLB12]HNR72581.1 DUF4432 family protein [Cyclobacteriaceae bacterium]HNU40982.1 DUF4432 family protein [Cyclobacteriaceae bacterium]
MSCQLSEIRINDLRAIYLENNFLKIGVLTDRGCDIFEFRYKKKDIDFLLRLPKGIVNPQTNFSQVRSTKNQFEDYYYGGWQVCLPNSPAFNYRGAELGQHGEVSLIPWEVSILKNTAAKLSIKCSAQPLRVPVKIERTFSLEKDAMHLVIEEHVENLSPTPIDLMWGQHIAFGLPFLEEGVAIATNAVTMEPEPAMPEQHRFKRGEIYSWPMARSKANTPDDARIFSAKGTTEYSDLCYLEGFDTNAFYSVKNNVKNVGFAFTWDGKLFKSLWMWHERNAIKNFPWWGQCYTLALEPWTSRWTNEPQKAIDNKEWFILNARAAVKTVFTAHAFENDFNPK